MVCGVNVARAFFPSTFSTHFDKGTTLKRLPAWVKSTLSMMMGTSRVVSSLHSSKQSYSILYRSQSSAAAGPSSSASASASATTSSTPRLRNKDARRKTEVDLDKVDLVGPPDPISRIRPMYYAPVPAYSSPSPSSKGKRGAAPSSAGEGLPHPYSLSEFSQTSPTKAGRGVAKGLGYFRSYQEYVERVQSKAEEAEMRLRVSKLSTDNVTQRFWKDNNLRFSRDLASFRSDSQQRLAVMTPTPFNSSKLMAADPLALEMRRQQESEVIGKEESIFYANWLRDNGKRNRAYNVLVWKQAWEQVRLGARVAALRNWLRTLQMLGG